MNVYIHTYIRAFQTVCRKAQVKVDDSEENSSTGNPNHSPMRKSSSNYLHTISRSSSSTSISIYIHTYIHTYINTYIHTYTYYGALNILKVVDSELSSPQKSALDIYNVSLHTYTHTHIHTYIHTYTHIHTYMDR